MEPGARSRERGAMKPGPELDRRVAEIVGKPPVNLDAACGLASSSEMLQSGYGVVTLMEWLRKRDEFFSLESRPTCLVVIVDGRQIKGDTIAHALCLAVVAVAEGKT